MADETLFYRNDLSAVLDRQRASLLHELDQMSDDRILTRRVPCSRFA
jgi:hypothetical protein